MLTLLAEVLREPAFDAKEFEQLRASGSRASSSRRSEPPRSPSPPQTQLRPYPKGDIRYVETVDESDRRPQGRDARADAALPPRLLRRAAGELAVVGDFDAAALDEAGR